MIYRKKKVEKRINNKETEENNNSVNAWEIIKENLATINQTCDFIKKSLSNSTINANKIMENYNSQVAEYKKKINNTIVNLRNATDNLKMTKISSDSIKRALNLEETKKFSGLPHKLLN